MTTQEGEVYTPPKPPAIRVIGVGDIWDALKAGLADFARAPVFGLFFGLIYAAGGVAIYFFLTVYNQLWMILPIMIGFPLIGPFIAAGLYEVSRRIAAGQELSWRAVLITVFSQRERQMGWMAFVILFVFWIWVYQIRLLVALFLGFNTPSTLSGFVDIVLTTPAGLSFLAVGTVVGAVLALFLFTATVVSMPLLLDTELDFVSAIITSFKAVTRNPIPMLGWGVVVTLLSFVAMAPAFLGLLVILPVLGHATWHLYKRVTVPAET